MNRETLGQIALSIIIILIIWDALAFMLNMFYNLFDLRQTIAKYDPWFFKPAVDVIVLLFSWYGTIIANATGLTLLLIISYIYDLTEVEWER